MRKLIEDIFFFGAIIYMVKWIYEPSGTYEPVIALFLAAPAVIERVFGKAKFSENDSEEKHPLNIITPAITLTQSTSKATNELPRYTWTSASSFFAERFSSAFPGIRKTVWFEGQDAVERISQLLRPPLTFKTTDNSEISPIWWFGRGNLQVQDFRLLDIRTVLINCDEHKISKLAAVYSTSYKRLYVYVETEPMQPTGLYPKSTEYLTLAESEHNIYAEEYALVDGKQKISRAEYDDGHAFISGKLTEIYKQSELRVRHLTPYNFLICAHNSPINNSDFDQDLEMLLDKTLQDASNFQQLEEKIKNLPHRGENQ